MCYNLEYMKQKHAKWIKKYGEENVMPLLPEPKIHSGFTHPFIPGLTPDGKLDRFYWGLVPEYEQSLNIKYNTLNAKIEELDSKRSYKPYLKNRCVILADGFMEYHWTDLNNPKCKKLKYLIHDPNDEILAFAGLYSNWTDKTTGEIIKTVTLVTTDANQLMGQIHNSGLRMPVLLNNEEQVKWLDNTPQLEFADRTDIKLTATQLE